MPTDEFLVVKEHTHPPPFVRVLCVRVCVCVVCVGCGGKQRVSVYTPSDIIELNSIRVCVVCVWIYTSRPEDEDDHTRTPSDDQKTLLSSGGWSGRLHYGVAIRRARRNTPPSPQPPFFFFFPTHHHHHLLPLPFPVLLLPHGTSWPSVMTPTIHQFLDTLFF